jgi:hypothetical protein
MENLIHKISLLSDQKLIRLSKELQSTVVPENALIRDVIKNTEVETTVPVMAFIQVAGVLHAELAMRMSEHLVKIEEVKGLLNCHLSDLHSHRFNKSRMLIDEILMD